MVDLKILLLTVSDQQHHPLRKYIDLHCNSDFKSWESGFRAVCPDICTYDYYAGFVSSGPFGMENRIRELVQRNNIQLLIVPNLYYELSAPFLNELRGLGCRSLVIFFDDSMRFEETNRFYLSAFDYYLTHESVASKALYEPYGIDVDFFPNFPSYSFYKKIVQRLDKKYAGAADDVVFVGAKIADRDVFVNYLKDNGVNISVYGRGWDKGMLSSEDMVAAYSSSKISLNFVKAIGGAGQLQLKGRLFEIIMAGGFVLSEYSDELAGYFDIGRDIDTFHSPSELLDKTRFYIKNGDLRAQMAARAKDKVEKRCSFESNWLRYLTDIKSGTVKPFYPNLNYKVPAVSINSFLNWNFSFIYGRLMLGQYGLAYDQYRFCQRQLKGLACNSWAGMLLLKVAIKRCVASITRPILSRNQICRIKQRYLRFRGLAGFAKL